MKKILILFAHPLIRHSKVNKLLFDASKNIENVTLVDLYAEYPNFRIDIDKEQQRVLEHDVIVFMFPFYWYSTPSILKEWQDSVLEYGFAYGSGANALQGKEFLCAVTTGGNQQAYTDDGYNHHTVKDLLVPIYNMASMTKMKSYPPFALFSSRSAVEENRIEKHLEDWKKLLDALKMGKVDYELANKFAILNQDLSTIIKE